MKIFKLLVISSMLLAMTSANALVIYNNNSKSIRVEVMDCPSKYTYSFPTDWKSDAYNNNPIRYIEYLHINHVLANGQVSLDPYENPDMPSNVCLHIEGWSSWFGGVITKVRSTCHMTITDGGFLQGIRAEYNQGC